MSGANGAAGGGGGAEAQRAGAGRDEVGAGGPRLVLASGSAARRAMLQNAGLTFDVVPASIDETAVRQALQADDIVPCDIAEVLAIAKAEQVSARQPGAMVIGGDQILEHNGVVFEKPATMEVARDHLLSLRGHVHELHSSVALVQDGQTLWSHTDSAALTMRDVSPAFIGRYLSRVGDAALTSVGAYQIEGLGVQLFERIAGQHFTIMGMPLLPLLAELRQRGMIER
ncbi:MAG: Maf family protein [Pseudomonadota bacterium]